MDNKGAQKPFDSRVLEERNPEMSTEQAKRAADAQREFMADQADKEAV